MNILLINHYAGCPQCGMEFRPYYLAKIWQQKGHNVTIIAATYSHLRKNNKKVSQKIEEDKIDGIKYIWIQTPEYQGNGIGRIKNILTFTRTLSKNAKNFAISIRPDVVIASSTYPMDIKPAKKIADLSDAKLIFEIHDLWPLSPMELGGYSKFNPFIVWVQYFENYAYKKVDAVVSILPKTKQHCLEHGLKPEKWHYVPNGIFIDDWQNQQPLDSKVSERLNEIKQKGLFSVAYTGNLSVANILDVFIKSKQYLEGKPVALILLGTGTELENLKKLAKNYKDVYFFEPIVKQMIPKFLKKVDAVYIGLKKQPLFRFGISPNKIFDYMMAEKPIIHSVDAGNDLVAEAQAGISIEPENPKAVADAIIKLSQLSKNELIRLGQNGKKFVLENHNYYKIADKFLTILQDEDILS